ncbi:MAG: type VI secretion system baseplate subunit TssF [Acidobacteriota bacterium]|nr:MAG: type VI secretion system baseplate subunit TssF [Acidobacteriota bacterium]
MRDELLGYYERELVFLRKMGAEFSKRYPKIASRLLLDEEKIEDPHVERLIEAFAFLSARIALKLDDELPEITESFINVLYPHYQAPIPSMAIAQFTYGSPNDKLTTVSTLDRGSNLYSRPVDGTPCHFRTAYDTLLFPVEIEEAALESPAPTDGRGMYADSTIRLSLRCYGNSSLHEMKVSETEAPPKAIRFFLNGDPQLVYSLYEIILNHSTAVEFRAKEAPLDSSDLQTITNIQLKLPDTVVLTPDNIRPVGFDENEALIPYTKRSFSGYRLLTEYFTFPYKFLFFDIHGIDQAIARKFGSHFEIHIRLKDIVPPAAPVTSDTFRLGCSPIVNLFEKTADPIYLNQQKYEYHLIPDVHRQMSTEVYSVDQLVSTDPKTNTTREFSPFYSLRHTYGEAREKSFWYASRRQSQRPNDEGSEIFITFVDSEFNPRTPATDILTVKTTCTNRDLPAKLPFGGKESDFEVEGAALISRVRCLTKPTETIRPPQRKGAQWRLISHMNLNYLSLVNDENGSPEALREILQLYNFNDSSATRKQILGITSVSAKPVIRRIGQRVGAGFVRGLETTIAFDEEEFVGSGMYLFASVLERFLGVYVSLNSFNQLVIESRQREGEIKRWRPRTGDQVLL